MASAAGTVIWEMNTWQDFIRGRFDGISLNREGRLLLAPKKETLFASDQPIVWSVAQGADGTIYAGTGHRGRVFQVDKSGKSSVLAAFDQPEVFAVAVDPKGVLYAATSPDGKVYRIEKGQAKEFFSPGARYIWSLVAGRDGSLFVGTGDGGKVFRVDASGKGELYYDTGQAHITSMSLDRDGRLLAGSEPNGILYRITARDKAFVLYDANLPEIRAIVPAPDGTIYAAALGGSVAKQSQGAMQAVQGMGASGSAGVSSTMTVTAEAAAPGELKPQTNPAQQTQPAAIPQMTTQVSPIVDFTGMEKSALYKINPDNTVETLWSSKEENIYDLAMQQDQLVFGTDGNGRIYRLSPDRKVTLVLQTNEAEATRLLSSGNSILAATGHLGRIYRLEDGTGPSGIYESPVHDAGTIARWGRLTWRGETAPGGSVALHTRSGNSLRPDKTWSDWSAPLTDGAGSVIPSPNARYIQWKAELAGGGKVSGPVLEGVTVAYLPQNSAPEVKSVAATLQAGPVTAPKPTAQAPTAAYTLTVTDGGDATAAASAGTPTQTLSRTAPQQINISWQAEDTDGDRLVYALHFRGEGEREWKLLKSGLHETTHLIDADALADGKYFFRVTASDREANAPSAAREADLVGAAVLIDNTPPAVVLGTPRRNGSRIEIDVEGIDSASPLRRCEYSIDAAEWVPIEAQDGVIDAPREKFSIGLEGLSAGEHILVVRAVDSGGNAGLAKIVLRQP